jgi:8-oxo-dGTP pyrophosphatase MutT (NUDIX family)
MPAAVLVLIYPKNGEYCILLNKRSQQVEHHKGEISFPGGGRDPEDGDFLQTALREAHEEMGIRPEDVTLLGRLDDVITRSNFGVHVFVGTISYPYPFNASAREVAEVLEVPISGLLDPRNQREEARWTEHGTTKSYCYAYEEHLIFGATAQMVTQFLDVFQASSAGTKAGTKEG